MLLHSTTKQGCWRTCQNVHIAESDSSSVIEQIGTNTSIEIVYHMWLDYNAWLRFDYKWDACCYMAVKFIRCLRFLLSVCHNTLNNMLWNVEIMTCWVRYSALNFTDLWIVAFSSEISRHFCLRNANHSTFMNATEAFMRGWHWTSADCVYVTDYSVNCRHCVSRGSPVSASSNDVSSLEPSMLSDHGTSHK